MPLPQNPKQAADPAQLQRLAASLQRSAGADWRQRRYGIAVSGGPDSMALTSLMASLLPQQIAAATIDHGFREASADEAQMVAAYCAHGNIDHHILRPDTAIEGSLQAAARLERYRLLENWRKAQGLDFLVTAHHADDQLETLLMRLNRSSGVGGLSGIRRRNGHILRPLLDWRRADLLSLVRDAGIPFVDDPSNGDHRFDRARLRHALRGQTMIDPQAASRSADWLSDADDALEWAVDAAMARWPGPPDTAVHDTSVIIDESYPPEIFRRIVTRRIHAQDPALKIRGSTLDAVILAMKEGRRAMVGSLIIDRLAGTRAVWRISAAPRRKTAKKA